MKKWAFIYTLSGDSTEVLTNEIGDEGCRLLALGVPAPAQAVGQIEALIADGVELIECCGAFGPSESAALIDAIAGRVPFGVVTYPCGEATRLHNLFG